MKRGNVYLTGGGCGDAGLLTLRALEVLRSCDVVVYDSLLSEELLGYTRADCEKIYVGKRYGSHSMKQSEINDLLIEKAREGKNIVRLKGGDPYVFGRGGEEYLAMQAAGIPCEEISGISSAIAVPAAAGIPVTHRGAASGFTVVTGTAAAEDGHARLDMDFDMLARLEGTLVILMGMHHLKEIADGLLRAGKNANTPCAVIMEGTTGRQRCLRTVLKTLYEEAKMQGFTSPAVIVIGTVAALNLAVRREEGWKVQPVGKITVGVTGTPRFVEKVRTAFRGTREENHRISHKENETVCEIPGGGFEVWDMGFMEVRPSKSPLPDLGDYEWLVFTSPNGIRVFLDKLRQERKDLRMLCGKQIAVIGPGTARVFEENGIYADYMPEIYDTAHLAGGLVQRILHKRQEEYGAEWEEEYETEREENGEKNLKEQDINRKRISTLFLRAKQGSEMLPQTFAENGLTYREYPLYELAVCEEKRETVLSKKPDYMVFGSAMGVRAYFEGMEQAGLRNDVSRYVCIGEQCAEELRKHTMREYLTAKESSIEAVAACICEDAADNK